MGREQDTGCPLILQCHFVSVCHYCRGEKQDPDTCADQKACGAVRGDTHGNDAGASSLHPDMFQTRGILLGHLT